VAIHYTHPAKRLLFSGCLVALWALALVLPATAAPTYNIVPLGFDDLEHTRNEGYKFNGARQLNKAGQVLGYSFRYNGGGTDLGYSAWLFDGATTINIGLTGSEYTRNDGYKDSRAYQLNEAGQVRGVSLRYNGGSTEVGQSAWLYKGATTIDIGLTGSEYPRNDGYRDSRAYQMNEAGQVSGFSNRYSGSGTDLGRSAWLYDGAATIDIGLTGSEYTRNDGYQYSIAYEPERDGAGQWVLRSLQRRKRPFGPNCLALRWRDLDYYRPHGQ
jgi:hypothetical protein